MSRNINQVIAATMGAGGTGTVADIRKVGTREGGIRVNGTLVTGDLEQQAIQAAQYFEELPKGNLLLLTLSNTSDAVKDFTLFDAKGLLRDNAVAPAIGNGVEISTNFYGGLPYTAFLKWLESTRISVVGMNIEFSETDMIASSNLKVHTGSMSNRNSQSLQEYVQMAKSKIITDQKMIDMNANFYINNLFGLSGKIDPGKKITFTLSIPLMRNF